jgi:FAD/FMN-containing dehydrogenase/Fe-S oxidoreductase
MKISSHERLSTEGAFGDRLSSELAGNIRGEVRFDEGSRALYVTDGSNYRQVPIGVVLPRHAEDAVRTVEICRSFGVPILGRGAATSLAGQCCNVAVVIDFSKYMHRILEIDPERRIARVEPGVVLDSLQAAASPFGMRFMPDPSTHMSCTIGGMIGNNSCGVHSVMGGKVEENVEDLWVLTYDGLQMRVGETSERQLEAIVRQGGRRGEMYASFRELAHRHGDAIRDRYPRIPRRVSGYNLNELLPENRFHLGRALVGTESTCAITLEATLRLLPDPPAKALVVLGYPDVYGAADHVMDVLAYEPIGLEGIDNVLVEDMKKKRLHPQDLKLLPEGAGWLLVEFGAGTKHEADAKAKDLIEGLKKTDSAPSAKLYDDHSQEALVWEIRESGLGATARVPGKADTWEGWEDSAVPPERLGDYLRDLHALYRRYGYFGALYGHFGQGCIHTRINFDLVTADGIRKFRAFLEDASDLVVSLGGSLSGEHGDGQSRAELLPKMFGDELVKAFGQFKAIWDPDNRMNPGKVVEPYRVTENLRLGVSYQPPELRTRFRFPQDDGSFARAVERCVGVGKCRQHEGGVMCPSYMATMEEEHTTRGRARLLFEMLQGDSVTDGWRSEAVKGALDLCLACKGCKGECPVNVDMATYKAEFLSHFYEGRVRPAAAYSMGLIDIWARLGSRAPSLVNAVSQNRALSVPLKRLAGIAQARRVPQFAPTSFRRWYRRRRPAGKGRPVILWADTFNDNFQPAVLYAGLEVLEAAGFAPMVPPRRLCCGRPLYDFGMLDRAKRYLRRVIGTLQSDIRAGVPVVGLERSCISVFRDELVSLLPNDLDARRLSEQAFLLSEFLEREGFEPPKLGRMALVQLHCHHRSVLGTEAEQKLMEALALDAEILDGCCGMAGSFGFEREKYDISLAVGERALLPAVRAADRHTLLVADGFSCREQIWQGVGRRPLHLAQVIRMAMG